ncbi:ATP-binding protein [Streptomyces violaceorubidus]
MATVELRFSALPEHVRTARLVAAAVARRAGVDEAVLGRSRLAAFGEASRPRRGPASARGITAPVKVALIGRRSSCSSRSATKRARSPG